MNCVAIASSFCAVNEMANNEPTKDHTPSKDFPSAFNCLLQDNTADKGNQSPVVLYCTDSLTKENCSKLPVLNRLALSIYTCVWF